MPHRNSKPVSSKISPQTNGAAQLGALSKQLNILETTHESEPIVLWNPDYCGEMDLVILANGDWIHEGRKMTRHALVKLFARVLWRETQDGVDQYFLKTPVEKIGIRVEDAPLVVIQVDFVAHEDSVHPHIVCTTNTDDQFTLDSDHPIFMRTYHGEPRPYTIVRRNIEALFHRNAYFHLIAQGEIQEDQTGQAHLIIHSGHHRFALSS